MKMPFWEKSIPKRHWSPNGADDCRYHNADPAGPTDSATPPCVRLHIEKRAGMPI